MRLSYIFLLGVALITLPFIVAIAAQYDDDTTPRKVQLEDLEEEQDVKQHQNEQLRQFTQQQLPLPANHKPYQQQRPAQPPPLRPRPIYYEIEAGIREKVQTLATPLLPSPLHVPQPPPTSPHQRPASNADYEAASASHHSLGVRPFAGAGNGIAADDASLEDVDDLRREPPTPLPQDHAAFSYSHEAPLLQQLLHRHQLSGGYTLKHEQRAPFVLVSPFGAAGVDGNAAAQHQQQQQQHHLPLATPPPHYLLPRPLSQPNKPFGAYLPSEPAPLSSLQYAAAAGVQYVDNNNIDEDDDKGDGQGEGEGLAAPPSASAAIEYSHEHFPHARPQLEYDSPPPPPPHAHFLRRPNFAQSSPQSKQLAFAPQRPETAKLVAGAVKIPYPPSFISITSRRPLYTKSTPLSGRAYYAGDFKSSQPELVPDFFAHRQSKSLLDSYIPSWLVAKMLQQPRQGADLNTLAYASATPLVNKHYKRELSQKGAAVKQNSGKQIVKKSLAAHSVEKEEMLMTA